MEKLQKALQKARATRNEAPPAAERPLVLDRRLPDPAPAAEAGTAPAEVEAWDALAPLEVNPEALVRNRVFTLNPGQAATPFDILRTKIQLMMRKNGWTRLAITSPTAACGKSTTACNLAVGFSRQPEFRAILIELDLHRPTMTQILGFTPKSDVTSMLSGKTSFAEQAVRLRSNVAISAARRTSGDPTAVLLHRRTHEVLAGIERTYAPDMVIFDLPPLLTSDDTRAFLNDVDCALMVVRAETSTVSQIDACEREIAEHTNLLGVVLNQCRYNTQDYGYGYGYGYSSGQGEEQAAKA